MSGAFDRVQGVCPACNSSSLFLASGGHVTCSRAECSDPCAADRVLHDFNTYKEALIERNTRLAMIADLAAGKASK